MSNKNDDVNNNNGNGIDNNESNQNNVNNAGSCNGKGNNVIASNNTEYGILIKVIKYFLRIIKSQLGTAEAAIARSGKLVETHKSDRVVVRDIVVARFPL